MAQQPRVVDAIEVDDKAIRIIGSRDVLQAVIAGKQAANGNVRGFVRNWRAGWNETTNTYIIDIPCSFKQGTFVAERLSCSSG